MVKSIVIFEEVPVPLSFWVNISPLYFEIESFLGDFDVLRLSFANCTCCLEFAEATLVEVVMVARFSTTASRMICGLTAVE